MVVASMGAVVCGTWQLGKAFVPAVQGTVAEDARSALRGTEVEQVKATNSTSSSVVLVGASGAVAMALMGGSQRSRAVRKSAAAVETEPAVPPPPPPFAPSEMPGVTAPLGFFDPLNFSKVGDEEGFRKLRIAEIKHARVAMMAAVGAVVQHYIQFPGFENIPKGIFAATSGNGLPGFGALFVLSGVLELFVWKDDDTKPAESIGDYGNPVSFGVPLGDSPEMRTRELNNGRAAMFAILGIIVAELLTGKDGVQQLGFDVAKAVDVAAVAAK
jgi:hypothetical protein